LGPQAESAAPNLIAALSDDSPLVAQSASMALGRIGPSVIPLIIERLRYAPTNDTVWATRALRFMGTNALPAARVTARLLPYPLSIGDEAALTLATMGPGALPELTSALKDTNTATRSRAIMAITILGPRGVPATNALREARNDSDPAIRDQASRALSNIAIYLPQ
jgi:HEAT repeat protein